LGEYEDKARKISGLVVRLVEKFPSEIGEAITMLKEEREKREKALAKPGLAETERRSIVADQEKAYEEIGNKLLELSKRIGEKTEIAGREISEAADKMYLLEAAEKIVKGMEELSRATIEGVSNFLADFKYNIETIGAMKGLPRFEELPIGKAAYELTPTERLMKIGGEAWQNTYKAYKILSIHLTNMMDKIKGEESKMQTETMSFVRSTEPSRKMIKAYGERLEGFRDYGKRLTQTFWERRGAFKDPSTAADEYLRNITIVTKKMREVYKVFSLPEALENAKEELKTKLMHQKEIKRLYEKGYFPAQKIMGAIETKAPMERYGELLGKINKPIVDLRRQIPELEAFGRKHPIARMIVEIAELEKKRAEILGMNAVQIKNLNEELESTRRRIEELGAKLAEGLSISSLIGELDRLKNSFQIATRAADFNRESIDKLLGGAHPMAVQRPTPESLRGASMLGIPPAQAWKPTRWQLAEWERVGRGEMPNVASKFRSQQQQAIAKYEYAQAEQDKQLKEQINLIQRFREQVITAQRAAEARGQPEIAEGFGPIIKKLDGVLEKYADVEKREGKLYYKGAPEALDRIRAEFVARLKDLGIDAEKISGPVAEAMRMADNDIVNAIQAGVLTLASILTDKEFSAEAIEKYRKDFLGFLGGFRREAINIAAKAEVQRTRSWIEKRKIPEPWIERRKIISEASGGKISGPGGPKEDRVPIMSSAGEYVIRTASAKRLGYNTLNYINATGRIPGFQWGGEVTELEPGTGVVRKIKPYQLSDLIDVKKHPEIKKHVVEGLTVYESAGIFSAYHPKTKKLLATSSMYALETELGIIPKSKYEPPKLGQYKRIMNRTDPRFNEQNYNLTLLRLAQGHLIGLGLGLKMDHVTGKVWGSGLSYGRKPFDIPKDYAVPYWTFLKETYYGKRRERLFKDIEKAFLKRLELSPIGPPGITTGRTPKDMTPAPWERQIVHAPQFAQGGSLQDDIPILASDGEFILNKDAAKSIGYNKLNSMNKTGQLPGFAKGGAVRFQAGGMLAPSLFPETFEEIPVAMNQAMREVGGVPKWGREHPNLYGLGGAGVGVGRALANAARVLTGYDTWKNITGGKGALSDWVDAAIMAAPAAVGVRNLTRGLVMATEATGVPVGQAAKYMFQWAKIMGRGIGSKTLGKMSTMGKGALGFFDEVAQYTGKLFKGKAGAAKLEGARGSRKMTSPITEKSMKVMRADYERKLVRADEIVDELRLKFQQVTRNKVKFDVKSFREGLAGSRNIEESRKAIDESIDQIETIIDTLGIKRLNFKKFSLEDMGSVVGQASFKEGKISISKNVIKDPLGWRKEFAKRVKKRTYAFIPEEQAPGEAFKYIMSHELGGHGYTLRPTEGLFSRQLAAKADDLNKFVMTHMEEARKSGIGKIAPSRYGLRGGMLELPAEIMASVFHTPKEFASKVVKAVKIQHGVPYQKGGKVSPEEALKYLKEAINNEVELPKNILKMLARVPVDKSAFDFMEGIMEEFPGSVWEQLARYKYFHLYNWFFKDFPLKPIPIAKLPDEVKKAYGSKGYKAFTKGPAGTRAQKEEIEEHFKTHGLGGLIQKFQSGGIAEILKKPVLSKKQKEEFTKFVSGITPGHEEIIKEAETKGILKLTEKEAAYLERLRKRWASERKIEPRKVVSKEREAFGLHKSGEIIGRKAGGAIIKALGVIPQYKEGINYVPRDQLAYVHKGEAIISAGYQDGGVVTGVDAKAIAAEIKTAVKDAIKETKLELNIDTTDLPEIQVASPTEPIIAQIREEDRRMLPPLEMPTIELDTASVDRLNAALRDTLSNPIRVEEVGVGGALGDSEIRIVRELLEDRLSNLEKAQVDDKGELDTRINDSNRSVDRLKESIDGLESKAEVTVNTAKSDARLERRLHETEDAIKKDLAHLPTAVTRLELGLNTINSELNRAFDHINSLAGRVA